MPRTLRRSATTASMPTRCHRWTQRGGSERPVPRWPIQCSLRSMTGRSSGRAGTSVVIAPARRRSPGSISSRRPSPRIPAPWRVRARRAIFGEERAALAELARTSELADADASTLELIGNSIGSSGDASGAIAFLARARDRHPSDPWLVFSEGYWCLRHDPPRSEEAAECFWVAIALRPGSSAMWAHYGIALFQRGQHERALEVFRRAARLDPSYPHARFGIGQVLQEKGDTAGAAAAFTATIALNPGSHARALRARVHPTERGQVRGSERCLRNRDPARATSGRGTQQPRDGASRHRASRRSTRILSARPRLRPEAHRGARQPRDRAHRAAANATSRSPPTRRRSRSTPRASTRTADWVRSTSARGTSVGHVSPSPGRPSLHRRTPSSSATRPSSSTRLANPTMRCA